MSSSRTSSSRALLSCPSCPPAPPALALPPLPPLLPSSPPSHPSATPNQDLVLQLCPEHWLGGLLPWHSRVTTFMHLGPLRCVDRAALRVLLLEYGGVTQRYGK